MCSPLRSRRPKPLVSMGPLPSYDGGITGQSSTHTQHAESECDGFGTVVTEVTKYVFATRR